MEALAPFVGANNFLFRVHSFLKVNSCEGNRKLQKLSLLYKMAGKYTQCINLLIHFETDLATEL